MAQAAGLARASSSLISRRSRFSSLVSLRPLPDEAKAPARAVLSLGIVRGKRSARKKLRCLAGARLPMGSGRAQALRVINISLLPAALPLRPQNLNPGHDTRALRPRDLNLFNLTCK